MSLEKVAFPYKPAPQSVEQIERWFGIEAGTLLAEIGEGIFNDEKLAFAYLGGSIADGFGNATSDLDVYAIYIDEIPRDLRTGFRTSFGRAVQLTAGTLGKLRSNITYLNKYGGRAGDLSVAGLQYFHRLRKGLALHNEAAFIAERETLDWPRFKGNCSAYAQFVADNNFEDACGNTEADNLDTAMLIARQSVGHALDAVLALLGETAPGDKWRYDKAKRALYPLSPDLVERCFALEAFAPIDSQQSKREFIADCELVYHGLSDAKLLIELNHRPAALPTWLFEKQTGAQAFHRNADVALRSSPVSAPMLWRRSEDPHQLAGHELSCWIALPRAANVAQLTARANELSQELGSGSAISEQQVARTLDDWLARRLIVVDHAHAGLVSRTA